MDQPAAVVYAYATDPARFPEWEEGVVDDGELLSNDHAAHPGFDRVEQ